MIWFCDLGMILWNNEMISKTYYNLNEQEKFHFIYLLNF